MKIRRLMQLLPLLLVVLAGSALRGQVWDERFGRTTSISILVVDKEGNALPGVRLDADTPYGHLSAVTDAEGRVNVPNVPPGQYTVTASLQGFAVATVNITASIGQSSTVTIRMGGEPTLSIDYQTFTEPNWNVWAEDRSEAAAYQPVQMQPNTDYSLVVNLAAIAFDVFSGETVFSHEADKALSDWIDAHPEVDSKTVQLVLLPDRRFFGPQPVTERVKEFRIDLKKLRKAKKEGFRLTKPPMTILHDSDGVAPFSFGTQTFRIHTRNDTGMAGMGVSIWLNGKPIDELSVGLCISATGEHCGPQQAVVTNSLKGVDLGSSEAKPDAAMHLLDRPSDIAGVFYCNTCGWGKDAFKTWAIEMDADEFAKKTVQILDGIAPRPAKDSGVTVEDMYEHGGEDLINLIFTSPDPDAQVVQKELGVLTGKGMTNASAGKRPPSLFVRVIPSRSDLVLIPVNLLRVAVPKGGEEFLGYYVNVRSPLDRQNYSAYKTCVSDWTLFVPPAKNDQGLRAVSMGRARFDPWIKRFRDACGTCVYDSENDFDGWLKDKDNDKKTASGLIILSHHDSNSLYFYQGGSPSIHSTAVARAFKGPSVVIIAACGSGKPGAADFVKAFNANHAATVIASSNDVDAAMGGEFLSALMAALHSHAADQTYTVT
ncbi:MAG TPA: carboxypeptidase-like regulatory domain-containing protein, partial [Nitrospira sp.]|nr:carboxypeptidase-like regulatory domain-containing protein [Nitrospira sp.]